MQEINRAENKKTNQNYALRTIVNTELSQVTWGELQRERVLAAVEKEEHKRDRRFLRKYQVNNSG